MTWQDDATAHAIREAPREACGLVVLIDGETRYWPCRNVERGCEFEIDLRDFARADDAGEIVGVFHSHSDRDAEASPRDVQQQALCGFPWHIRGADGEWRTINA